MKTYLDCWTGAATALFAQALAGEPELAESLPKPLARRLLRLCRHHLPETKQGRFAVVLDGAVLDTPLVGEGMDQKAGWAELLREVADVGGRRAAGQDRQEVPRREIRSDRRREQGLARLPAEVRRSHLDHPGPRRGARSPAARSPKRRQRLQPAAARLPRPPHPLALRRQPSAPGIELLLDVELDASLRFGCREMPLGEILDLGPGDVVQLDRHIADPVDLIVGDKIVARGEVVLVNGNFGLRVTEVAAPRKRLESIRCLF